MSNWACRLNTTGDSLSTHGCETEAFSHLGCLQAVRRQRGAAQRVSATQPANSRGADKDDAARSGGKRQLRGRWLSLQRLTDQLLLAVPMIKALRRDLQGFLRSLAEPEWRCAAGSFQGCTSFSVTRRLHGLDAQASDSTEHAAVKKAHPTPDSRFCSRRPASAQTSVVRRVDASAVAVSCTSVCARTGIHRGRCCRRRDRKRSLLCADPLPGRRPSHLGEQLAIN